MPTFLSLLADRPLPLPGDPRRAEMMLAQAKETVLAEVMADPKGNRLLESVFGNSPFLARSLLREPEYGRLLAASDPELLFSTLIGELHPKALIPLEEAAFMQTLRVARRRVALLIALADIAGIWSMQQSTWTLSRFADWAVQGVVAYLLAGAAQRGELELPDPDDPAKDSGFFVLALGKMGALELNYSSDIDLMLLYDQAKVRYVGKRSAQECFVRLARNLIRLMQDATPDGYVCRVDLQVAARSRLDALGHVGARRRDLLRRHGPELGTRSDDQGASLRRR